MRINNKVRVAIVFGCVGFLSGGYFSFTNPSGNKSADIKMVEKKIYDLTKDIGKPMKGYPDVMLVSPSMKDVSAAVEPLIFANQQIAIAKVLTEIDADIDINDLPWNAPKWEKRNEYANRPWLTQETSQRIGKSILLGLASSVIVFIVAFVSILIIFWGWYFLLERIKELSIAIRGGGNSV